MGREEERDDATTHLVQIVDNSHQIIVLDVRHPSFVLLLMKYVADVVVKVG